MAGTKLSLLQKEAQNYLGIPYFINLPLPKEKRSNLYSGKGRWDEIKAVSSDYNTLKKNHIGIDCSGLAYHLLDFYALHTINKPISEIVVGTNNQSDVRHLSADLLTSPPNAIPITDYSHIRPADLIRSKSGRHVAIILAVNGAKLDCIESSRQSRGVRLFNLSFANLNKTDGVFRLKGFASISPQSTPYT